MVINEEKRAYALSANAFVRDEENDLVYCPQGQVMTRKSTKKDGRVRYVAKHACRLCEARCFQSGNANGWKEVDFYPGSVIKRLKGHS